MVLGLPRSGTSLVTRLCISAGYDPEIFPDSKFFGGSPYNKDGYNEEVRLTLLNDQLIRGLYGGQYSFLYPPEVSDNLTAPNLSDEFYFDIDKSSLSLPDDFENKLTHYTGTDFDYWGLTRMRENEKWYKAYTKFGLAGGLEIKKTFLRYNEVLRKRKRLVLKDPRLCITGHLYDLTDIDIVFVERDFAGIEHSMRRHYGPRLFSSNTFKCVNWVSNHFNLKVGPMSKSQFLSRYNDHLIKMRDKKLHSFTVNYNLLVQGDLDHISQFEKFLGQKVDKDLIKLS